MGKEPTPAGRDFRGLLAPLALAISAVLLHAVTFHALRGGNDAALTLSDRLDALLALMLCGGIIAWPRRRSPDTAAGPDHSSALTQARSDAQASLSVQVELTERIETNERQLAASHAALARENEERTYAEEKLRRVSTQDNLTGLYKRSAFITQLELLRLNSPHLIAIVFVDIDHFKLINDGLGDSLADRVLVAVGDRLQHLSPKNALLGRVGGDEFALACEVQEASQGQTIAEHALESIAKPIAIDGQRIHTSSSIGVRISNNRDERAATLLRDAHTAMHRAKQGGRARYVTFDTAMRDEVEHQYALTSELREAVLHEEIFVEYQPIHDLRDGRVIAYEALARWEHPGRGRIEPGVFIPAAEDSGLVAAIGEKVLRDACEQIIAHGITSATPIGVNLSARELAQPDLCESITHTLASYNIDPSVLLFEVTESTIVESLNLAREVLLRLKKFGFRIAIDDFGTGYSSLSYLRSLPFDVLKIDRAFVRHIDTEEHSRDIVRMIVTLADSLDLSVVAEGIETTPQLTTLRDLGCYRGQGFLFSRPLPAAAAFAVPALPELMSRT